MKIIKNQILAGTHLDSQGERCPKEVLDSFCEMYRGKVMPLNQQHDLSMSSPGFVENLRVILDESNAGEWLLVGDVQFDGESQQATMGGFSISFLEILRRSMSQELFHIYLPYPYYNDQAFVDELFEEGFVSVGRWAKKAADPATVGLVSATIVFFLKPIWEDLYKTQIAPHVYQFFSKKIGKLKEKDIAVNFVQHVVYNGCEIQVMLIPAHGKEEQGFEIEATNQAMVLVHSKLTELPSPTIPVSKIYLQFEEKTGAYELHHIEYQGED
jgi:hypothetical protein